jgi:hypothetical protein
MNTAERAIKTSSEKTLKLNREISSQYTKHRSTFGCILRILLIKWWKLLR